MLVLYSELELKPQGKITLTVVRANDLKNMEMIGKSDLYVVVYIRPLFKVKTKVIDNNLNPIWDQTFELIAEDKETQAIVFEVISPSLIVVLLLRPDIICSFTLVNTMLSIPNYNVVFICLSDFMCTYKVELS